MALGFQNVADAVLRTKIGKSCKTKSRMLRKAQDAGRRCQMQPFATYEIPQLHLSLEGFPAEKHECQRLMLGLPDASGSVLSQQSREGTP